MTGPIIQPAPELARQFELLKFRIQTALDGKLAGSKVLAFTSYTPGEGVTGVMVNFASSLINDRSGGVLMLDGNLRRPSLRQLVAPGRNARESQELLNERKEIMLPAWQLYNFDRQIDLMLSHHPVEEADRIFGTPEFQQFLSRTREYYRYVLIDCPPISVDACSVVLAARADAVILVVEAEHVRREVLRHAVTLLESSGANVLGVVLNKCRYPIPQAIYKLLR